MKRTETSDINVYIGAVAAAVAAASSAAAAEIHHLKDKNGKFKHS